MIFIAFKNKHFRSKNWYKCRWLTSIVRTCSCCRVQNASNIQTLPNFAIQGGQLILTGTSPGAVPQLQQIQTQGGSVMTLSLPATQPLGRPGQQVAVGKWLSYSSLFWCLIFCLILVTWLGHLGVLLSSVHYSFLLSSGLFLPLEISIFNSFFAVMYIVCVCWSVLSFSRCYWRSFQFRIPVQALLHSGPLLISRTMLGRFQAVMPFWWSSRPKQSSRRTLPSVMTALLSNDCVVSLADVPTAKTPAESNVTGLLQSRFYDIFNFSPFRELCYVSFTMLSFFIVVFIF